MVDAKSSIKSSVSSFKSQTKENYYRQLNAFKELHEETKNLSYLNNKLKRENKLSALDVGNPIRRV